MLKIITVVVTFNRKQLLLENINALLSQTYKDNRILVVDNASADGTKEAISTLVDNNKVFYFNTGSNKGGSYGFSIGTEKAIQMGCDAVWLMDDDCIPEYDALEKLLDYGASINNNFGYLSSKVLFKDRSMCLMNIPKKNIATRINDFNKNQPICIASFVSLLVKSNVVEEVGLPMRDFFLWGDDWEYTLRISKKYPSYFVASSVVVHKSKVNQGVNIQTADTKDLWKYQYAYRNECYFYRQAGFFGRLYLLLKIILHTARVLFKKCNHKILRLSYIYKYTFKGFSFKPHTDFVFNKNSDIKVLEFFGDPISYGGQEMFMINMYKNITNKHLHFTFGTPFYSNNKDLPNLTAQRGDKIISLGKKEHGPLRMHNIVNGAKKILKTSGHYDVIHIHSGSVFTLYEVSKLAKKMHTKKVIVHSHLGGEMNLKYKIMKRISDKKITRYADVFLACSVVAAEWKFPKNVLENKKYTLIKNGVDIGSYTFDEEIREKIRGIYNIGPSFALIHVGRFAKEKNHDFFLKLLPLLKKEIPDFRFICIGSGDEKRTFMKALEKENLINHFVFLENINNVNEYLFAADCFLLPSFHEGFPIALIEAEATGLPSIYSTLVTKEALLTSTCFRLPLSNLDQWEKQIVSIMKNRETDLKNRKSAAVLLANQGYDAKQSADTLQHIYYGEDTYE